MLDVVVGLIIVAVGVVMILIRRPFFDFSLRFFARFYGQPVADAFEHSGTKAIVVGAVGFIVFGVVAIVAAIVQSQTA